MDSKKQSRIRRARRSRAKIRELGAHRLCIYRSPRHIYAQLIAPNGSEVVASASTLDKEIRQQLTGATGNIAAAQAVGAAVAKRAAKAGITKIAFDRSGYRYHGRIKALADAARENGLQF
ncbi:MAG: large subunit ribosomal protein L18 [Gammaproteobacteria bacterium]|nr:MAG: large subunit ribosomal protein L18 [Gammaproteobacteria bacterium]TND06597.1 MAG: large subunit ribosomal protein L18 [Gammaproteobacteria bacterium]